MAFLRAVNVGGRVVKMEALRKVFESMRFANVATFIASGNVVFDSSSSAASNLEHAIEERLQKAFGYQVATFLRSVADLTEVARHRTFKTVEAEAGSSLYIIFLRDEPDSEAKRKVAAFSTDTDKLCVKGREVYWLCRTNLQESRFSGAALEKTLRGPATMRNATTVRRIVAKYCG